jgi:hypothetical protein
LPDQVQWWSYMAGKHPNVLLGSLLIVLPWHDSCGGRVKARRGTR